MNATVLRILEKFQKDRHRMMDILIDIQHEFGYIPEIEIPEIANELGISSVDVKQTLSFYHFFSTKPRGRYTVYLNNSIVSEMMGRPSVKEAFEESVGCKFGEVTFDGNIGLFDTSCIGMNDQEPAAIINNVVFTRLTSFRVKELVRDMKLGKAVNEMITEAYGDGNNASPHVLSMVNSNLRKKGPVIFADDYVSGNVLKKIVGMPYQEVINEVKTSGIRGRGGAGFPTGLKWEFCRKAKGEQRFVICNADEGEPGTFKDRVILTEKADLLFEGMTIAAYSIGATNGILYLRYEYKYLENYLEKILANRRENNLLGNNIAGNTTFNFDIRIQFGGGAYVCGEESALIESVEGKRGEPRDRPPFPVEKGYLNMPTVVNNVETLCATVKILQNGGEWYHSLGTKSSTGSKVLSISGDCRFPGVYEIEWGITLRNLLSMVGAENVQAIQVGGPSGLLVGPNEFNRTLDYSDYATGGSIIILGKQRDLLKEVVLNFLEFFIEESCGSCSTCRNFPMLIREKLLKILQGNGVMKDIDDMLAWSKNLPASRCGLGQTAANPVVSSIRSFRYLYDERIKFDGDFRSQFDMEESVKESCSFVKRIPIIH